MWTPDEERIKDANITKFIDFVNTKYNIKLESYSDLYTWSIENIELFWANVWEFVDIKATPYDKVVENLEKFAPETQWFVGAEINFAENLLKYRDDHIAFIFKNEFQEKKEMTYNELYNEVSRLHVSLKEMGVKTGDRVVGYMPNIMHTAIAMLGASTLGATWASCGSELGASAALDRLGQVKPKVLFTVDAYIYKGKKFDMLSKVREVVNGIPSIEKVIVLSYVDDVDISSIPKAISYRDFIARDPVKIDFIRVPFNNPQYIMFSSGTTGKPKCMVQGAGGVLINHLKELVLHTDLKRDDRIMYLTSPSWMMWNWLISSLAVGATVVLFDGNPLYPDWKTVFKLIDEVGVTIFGCSASYLHYLKNIGSNPSAEFNLSTLREISQTGSPLSDEGFEFVYTKIKKDLHLNSISGGTDINGCFAAGSPTLPVYSGELQARALGMRVKAYDDNANEVYDKQAELVCELPSPSMPIYFWEDENNEKYTNAYFKYFPQKKVWRHGDYVVIHSDTGGMTFYGRSDAVLKPSGVRIGTAEIYSIVEDLPEVTDSLAIGQNYKGDQRVILFVQLSEGYEFTEELKNKIKNELRTRASPRHVPALMYQCPDIPYTFSGKKVESAVTNIINGRPVTNRGALRNPESLDFYERIARELKE